MITRSALAATLLASAITPVTAPSEVAVQLMAQEALIMGPTGTSDPSDAYINDAVNQYLDYSGYTGGIESAKGLITPEGYSNQSYLDGEAALTRALQDHLQYLAEGNEVYVFGYSQSATIATAVDSSLPADLVPYADQIHLVLVGDPAAPDGFDNIFSSWMGMLGWTAAQNVNTNDVMSPTDVYTINGDNWAQASSWFGMPELSSWQHLAYLGLDASAFDPSEVIGNASYHLTDIDWSDVWTVLWDAFLAMM